MGNLYVKIRSKYGLSRAAMGKILGFGVNQWRLYEDGLEPRKSHAYLIAVASSPCSLLALLGSNQHSVTVAIGERRYFKLSAKVRVLIKEFEKLEEDRYREWVKSLWV